jgi:hypothetical protein
MPYVAANPEKFIGTSVGNGQCVAFARAAAGIGHTSTWVRGDPVRGANLIVGTAVATFGENLRYANDTTGQSHAAIYLGQDAAGIQVLDQWVKKIRLPDGRIEARVQTVHKRTIRFANDPKPVNDGRNYYVIE